MFKNSVDANTSTTIYMNGADIYDLLREISRLASELSRRKISREEISFHAETIAEDMDPDAKVVLADNQVEYREYIQKALDGELGDNTVIIVDTSNRSASLIANRSIVISLD